MGIVVTPLLAAVPAGQRRGGFSADSVVKIVLQLLVPFVAGQVLRRWIEGFVARHQKVLGLVDRRLDPPRRLHGVQRGHGPGRLASGQPGPAGRAAGRGGRAARRDAAADLVRGEGAGLRPGGRIAIQFAGSEKSLAAGLPMASVLFGAQASLAVLPLMLFHQMQLMVCAVIAKRRSRDQAVAGRAGRRARDGPRNPRPERTPGSAPGRR